MNNEQCTHVTTTSWKVVETILRLNPHVVWLQRGTGEYVVLDTGDMKQQ